MVYSCFQNPNEKTAREVISLCDAMIGAGVDLQCVGAMPSLYVEKVINFRTPVKYKNTSSFLEKYDHIVIYGDVLSRSYLRSNNIWAKCKELNRIRNFLNRLQNAGSDIYLVGSQLDHIIFSLFCPKVSVNYIPVDKSTVVLSQKILGKPVYATDVTSSCKRLQSYVLSVEQDLRFSVCSLRKHLAIADREEPELWELLNLASNSSLRKTVLCRRIKATDSLTEFLNIDSPPYELIAKAMRPKGQFALPAYLLHLRSQLKIAEKYPLRNGYDANKLLDWYKTYAREIIGLSWCALPNANEQLNTQVICGLTSYLNDPEHTELPSDLLPLFQRRIVRGGPSGLAIFLALLMRPSFCIDTLANPWQSLEIASWFENVVCKLSPNLKRFSTLSYSSTSKDEKRAQIIGEFSGDTGLSQNAKIMGQVLRETGLYCELSEPDGNSQVIARSFHKKITPKRDFNIYHVNADRMPQILLHPLRAYRNNTCHIGHFLWETSQIPRAHELGVEMCDEIWVPSEFVASLYRQMGAENVHVVRKYIPEIKDLSKPVKTIDAFSFLLAFDAHSSVERKNPLAAVKAFQRAFPRKKYDQVQLIIKTTLHEHNHWGDPMKQMNKIYRIAQYDPRINIVINNLNKPDLFRMMHRADCILSPHRGEGFGYFPAYALAMAKPLIVTNWGGVRDFCSSDTSWPVDYNLVSVPKGHAIYDAPGAQWADICVDSMAQAMREVYYNNDNRGLAGQKLINMLYSFDTYTDTLVNRLNALDLI